MFFSVALLALGEFYYSHQQDADSKDPRIDVDQISIRRESVGSMSNRRRPEGLGYLESIYISFTLKNWYSHMCLNFNTLFSTISIA